MAEPHPGNALAIESNAAIQEKRCQEEAARELKEGKQ